MKHLLLTLVISLSFFYSYANIINGSIPEKALKDAHSLNILLQENEISLQQIRHYAKNGDIEPSVLNKLNELNALKLFTEKEIENYESLYFGKIALEYFNSGKPEKTNKLKAANDNSIYANIFEEENTSGNTQFGKTVSNAGDFNGDGYEDFMTANPNYNGSIGKVYIYLGAYEPDTIPDLILNGEQSGDYFGYSVASAGDVNNDGFDDIIIGAWGFRNHTGKAYVYYGGSIPDNIVDIHLDGKNTGDAFANSVSSAGDVNNDGYDDLVIGARQFGDNNQGRVYIYFGGFYPDNTEDIAIDGENDYDYFGNSVSSAGDFNRDGFDDVIVGISDVYDGKAYIYFGSELMDNTYDLLLEDPNSRYFGLSVSSAGDINHDGYDDVIVGAPRSDQAFIFFGGYSPDNVVDFTFTGENSGDYFGNIVSNAGDVNNDGYDDVIVGMNKYNDAKVYIYYGNSYNYMDETADIVLVGESYNEHFGSAVSSLGDLNNDGHDDIIVGAYWYDGGTGRANVYYGNYQMDNITDLYFTGEFTNNYFGISVSSAGDVNNDGFDDIIIGAQSHNNSTGRAYIYYGGIETDNIADVILNGEGTNSVFGCCVSGAGDINRDGYDDVIVGASIYNNYTGAAYVYFGGPSMDNIVDLRMIGENSDDRFGYTVSSAGDINNDGFDDVIIGAINFNNIGRAYIYLGGQNPDNEADLLIEGETANSKFGIVSKAGDINNDGYDDIIIGGYGVNFFTGKAYLYYGGQEPDNIVDIVYNGENEDDWFGCSLSTAGDVNNDGFDDILIGAFGFNNTVGRAYIYFGGDIKDNVADIIFTGETTSNRFGYSVNEAGDINNDGYDDVIIGAYMYDNLAGRAYVYYGSETIDNSVDIILDPVTKYDEYFAYSVSGAGDVNNDGLDDLIIGAYMHPVNGAAYLYQGMLEPEITVQPENQSICENGEGDIWLTAAGEGNMNYQWQVNMGDGFEDIINEPGFSGENTNRLSLSEVNYDMNGYLFRCLVENNAASLTSEAATLTVHQQATVANAGVDQEICGNSTTLNGNEAIIGQGSWTTTGNASFTEVNLYNTEVSGLDEGENIFIWEITNGSCSTRDTVVITNHELIDANAGEDIEICNQTEQTLSANNPPGGSGLWSVVNGAGNFENAELNNTIVSDISPGTNTYRWTITNVACSSQDEMVITNYQQITANAGEDVQICDQSDYTLSGNDPSPGTGLWSCPDPDIYFDNAAIYNATAYNLPEGNSILIWSITNGECNSNDQVEITNNRSVTISSQPQINGFKTNKNVRISFETEGNVESYQWRKDGVDLSEDRYISGVNTNALTITNYNSGHYGNYDCRVTGICNEIYTNIITFSLISGIEEFSDKGIKIYPNPSDGIFNVEFENKSIPEELIITSLSGQKVYHKTKLNNSEAIDLSKSGSGVYFISIKKGDETIITKIIVH